MGSPIPGSEEGAWVREDRKVVGSVDPSTWNHDVVDRPSVIDSVDGQASSVNPCVWTH